MVPPVSTVNPDSFPAVGVVAPLESIKVFAVVVFVVEFIVTVPAAVNSPATSRVPAISTLPVSVDVPPTLKVVPTDA